MAPIHAHRVVFLNDSDNQWTLQKKQIKTLLKRLKRRFTVEHVSVESLEPEGLTCDDVLWLWIEMHSMTPRLLDIVQNFVQRIRGSLILLVDHPDENKTMSELLRPFGIEIKNEAILSTTINEHTYHPLNLVLQKPLITTLPSIDLPNGLLLPNTCSLNIQRPASAFLWSDHLCLPSHSPIGATWNEAGKVIVMGCRQFVMEHYIDKLNNAAYIDHLVCWIASEAESVASNSVPSPQMVYESLPDVSSLAEMPRYCPQIRKENLSLRMDETLLSFDLSQLPKVMELGKKLEIKNSKLSIIAPKFETPTPFLKPAYYPLPTLSMASPALELFDLDVEVQDKRQKLDIAFNRASNLMDFIKQAGEVCGFNESSSGILFKSFRDIVQYKQ